MMIISWTRNLPSSQKLSATQSSSSMKPNQKLMVTRGILRHSSYTPSTTDEEGSNSSSSSSASSSSSSDEDIILRPTTTTRNNRPPVLPVRKLPPLSIKPQRRNVGKVVRRGQMADDNNNRRKSISFNEKVSAREIPKIPRCKSNDFFYDEEEIATFRHEAFMEQCGLDASDYE